MIHLLKSSAFVAMIMVAHLASPSLFAEDSSDAIDNAAGSTPSEDAPATPLDDSVTTQPQGGTEAEDDAAGSIDEAAPKANKKAKNVSAKPKAAPIEQVPEVVAQPVSPPQVVIPEGAEISQGERLAIDGKGFSIKPPVGWIVQRNIPRISLSISAPVAEGQYPRNINVVRFSGPLVINQDSAERFGDKLVKDFPATSATIEGYTLRNSQEIQMADGRNAYLFYADFLGSGRKMMQAHVLLSSETNHYLISFTDVAENFESSTEQGQSQFFNDAWASITSTELDSPSPNPSQDLFFVIEAVVGLGFIWMVIGFLRRKMQANQYKEFSDDVSGPADNEELMTSMSQVRLENNVSLEPTLLTMQQSQAPIATADSDFVSHTKSGVANAKKLKLGKRGGSAPRRTTVEELVVKADEVSSIEFSQDKFKREI